MKLIIANKNYSSWSMRPWLLMTEFGISFEEVLIPFGILRLSYGVPIDRETTPFGRVEEDRFQIALGVDF